MTGAALSRFAMANLSILSVGEQEPEIQTVHPLATEAIWSEIMMHLNEYDQARVAGTCTASWDAKRTQFMCLCHIRE